MAGQGRLTGHDYRRRVHFHHRREFRLQSGANTYVSATQLTATPPDTVIVGGLYDQVVDITVANGDQVSDTVPADRYKYYSKKQS